MNKSFGTVSNGPWLGLLRGSVTVSQLPTSIPRSSTSLLHFSCFNSQQQYIQSCLHSSTVNRIPKVSRTSANLTNRFHNMSFSNADTGDKPADPYKQKNQQEVPLKEKVEGLVQFITSCKFGMMTTRIADTGMLTSRCMALAAKVNLS